MKILALLSVMSVSATAVAQTAAPVGDPGERTCRITGETGSRLQRTRTCKTRAEWDQERRDQRNMIDRAQTKQVNRTIDETGRVH